MLPPFVELDMSSEGFGCLYLPSIAPQSPAGPGVVTGALLSADNNVVGGIGSGDRLFPPQTGQLTNQSLQYRPLYPLVTTTQLHFSAFHCVLAA